MSCISRIEELAEEFTQIRHEFHAHPELSNKEYETAKTIARYLTDWGIEVHAGIGGTLRAAQSRDTEIDPRDRRQHGQSRQNKWILKHQKTPFG